LREVPFGIAINGLIRIDGNVITIIVNRTVTNVTLDPVAESPERTVFEPGKSMFDIILESAREFLKRKEYNRFSGLELYSIALESYPGLKKRSFMSRITAATPNHSSYKHHHSQRDYFQRIAPGVYSLEYKYQQENSSPDRVEISDTESGNSIEFTRDNK